MISDVVILVLMSYGFAALLVVLVSRISFHSVVQPQNSFTHYQVHVYNSENVLEGMIRRLMFRSCVEGKPIRISFVDYGSSDDTIQITQLFRRQYTNVMDSDVSTTYRHIVQIDLRSH
ncbi:hypothetical protein ACQCN2_09945 [Brevibacillus ginsengisoli]|uniref:hypothetical protein n=1 Tax=Brevibacillus ginsengisoli TaxID=363854 RepID=UPI003CF1A361